MRRNQLGAKSFFEQCVNLHTFVSLGYRNTAPNAYRSNEDEDLYNTKLIRTVSGIATLDCARQLTQVANPVFGHTSADTGAAPEPASVYVAQPLTQSDADAPTADEHFENVTRI